MSSKEPKKEVFYSGRFLSLVAVNNYEMVERINTTGVVLVIAVTEDQKLILVRQFRPPIGKDVIELPAGLVSDEVKYQGESFENAAGRELFEETGYEATSLEKVTVWPVSPGMSSEVVTVFRATAVVKKGPGGGNKDESIQVCEIPLKNASEELERMEKNGLAIDPKVYSALYLLGYWGKLTYNG